MAEPAIRLTNASAAYEGRAVLSGIDLTVRAGERVALMGRSGAGKSTLIGLIQAQAPERVALVPQAAALVRTLSVFHNVYMGRLDRHGAWRNLRMLAWPDRRTRAEVEAVLARVDLAGVSRQRAGSLSGGQAQRVSVARALYNGRPVVIGDEPVSALDRGQGARVLAVIAAAHPTSILALHDIGLALDHATRVLMIRAGRIVLDAPAATLAASDLARFYRDPP